MPDIDPLVVAEGGNTGLGAALDAADAREPAPVAETILPGPEALAYILYTSGKHGEAQGRHAVAGGGHELCGLVFRCFQPTAEDRFSSHAPFHFDLSILESSSP